MFNRPDQLNAMNSTMRDELADVWLELDGDPAVRAIVHTGEGRGVQTGVDVAELASDGLGMERYRESVEAWDLHFTSWHQGVWKPVITAVNGICAGGAFHWVADADIVIASSDAQFFDPHVSVGQVTSIEMITLLRKMPVEAVMRMALVGIHERMSVERGRRSSGCSARSSIRRRSSARPPRSWARPSPGTRRPPWPRRSGRCGRARARAHRRGAGPAPGSSPRCGGYADQEEGPRGVRREAPRRLDRVLTRPRLNRSSERGPRRVAGGRS
ncbi:MAG: enoyl-CoA hydratase/isomerase family protein [Acidimicrobiales bacterium]|nr:enoyl-CoA hydratase/isomerase family protein [Acidimicrobiales bacterium]